MTPVVAQERAATDAVCADFSENPKLLLSVSLPEQEAAVMDCDFGAFQLLEACMNNCGKRFQSEVAKFRFLNELIKVLSPKVRDGREASSLIRSLI